MGSVNRQLDEAPGPSPWYLAEGARLTADFAWFHPKGEDGVTLLRRGSDAVLALDFQNYVLPLRSGRILIWHQLRADGLLSEPIRMWVLELAALRPLGIKAGNFRRAMDAGGTPNLYRGEALAEASLQTTLVDVDIPHPFPKPIAELDELLLLCHSSAISAGDSWKQGDLALMVAHPKEQTLRLYPQDWYNNDPNMDYGYQWVTRAARDPQTGKVHGEGIRLGRFVLDASLRNLASGPGG